MASMMATGLGSCRNSYHDAGWKGGRLLAIEGRRHGRWRQCDCLETGRHCARPVFWLTGVHLVVAYRHRLSARGWDGGEHTQRRSRRSQCDHLRLRLRHGRPPEAVIDAFILQQTLPGRNNRQCLSRSHSSQTCDIVTKTLEK